MKFAGIAGLRDRRSNTLRCHGRRLQADGTLEKLIQLSAEGAKRVSLISQAKGQSLVFPAQAGSIMIFLFADRVTAIRFYFIYYQEA